ncbi:hypothetical protein LSAT2_015470 [Lamellibrachia satsuma]|nr:hypothetical protein LSAT2_015470 [Lamellibrachia satsuma]
MFSRKVFCGATSPLRDAGMSRRRRPVQCATQARGNPKVQLRLLRRYRDATDNRTPITLLQHRAETGIAPAAPSLMVSPTRTGGLSTRGFSGPRTPGAVVP